MKYKGGCVDFKVTISRKWGQGGRGSKNRKVLRTSFKYGPSVRRSTRSSWASCGSSSTASRRSTGPSSSNSTPFRTSKSEFEFDAECLKSYARDRIYSCYGYMEDVLMENDKKYLLDHRFYWFIRFLSSFWSTFYNTWYIREPLWNRWRKQLQR